MPSMHCNGRAVSLCCHKLSAYMYMYIKLRTQFESGYKGSTIFSKNRYITGHIVTCVLEKVLSKHVLVKQGKHNLRRAVNLGLGLITGSTRILNIIVFIKFN